jgi:DNA-binding transcriptional MocR family regulator
LPFVTTPTATVRALAGWEAGAGASLPERLAGALQRAMLEGRIALEARIPSERELATALGTSRATVSGAYAALRHDGWLTTRHGAGSVARLPPELRDGMAPSDARTAAGAIDLRGAAPAAPVTAFRTAAGEALAAITPELMSSVPTGGLEQLRAGIAERHARRGTATSPDEILVTSGALPGLWLALAALLPGAPRVAVEVPTYPRALDALHQRRARLTGWPVVDGWDTDELERLVREHDVAAAYLVPDFHNPTGRLMDADARARLAELAARHDLLLVVDETMIELDLRGGGTEAPPPLTGANVVALGSLSKAVWDGLHVGWIRASPAAIQRMAAHPLAAQLQAAPLEQAIAAALLPALDALVRARRRTLRARRDHLLAALDGLGGIHVAEPPAGGLSLWAALERTSSARLAVAAAANGVLVDPGGRFAPAGGLDRNLRLPYSLPEATLDIALERLAPLI